MSQFQKNVLDTPAQFKLAARVAAPELTRREIEVLTLVATGKTNKEISQALCISDATVKSHVKGIFSKLNVLSRTEAVASAGRRGLIRLN